MPDVANSKQPAFAGNLLPLPFGALLQVLAKEGFTVDAKDFMEFTAAYHSFAPEHPAKLKHYLAPIICKNEEEQRKFYALYDGFIQQQAPAVATPKKNKPLWIPLTAILLLAVLAIIYEMATPPRPAPRHAVKAYISQQAKDVTRVFDTLEYNSVDSMKNMADSALVHAVWDFGDGSAPVKGHKVHHVYRKAGNYTIALRLNSDRLDIVKPADQTTITICPPEITLTNASTQTLYTGDSLKVTAGAAPGNDASGSFWVIVNNDNYVKDTFPNTGNTLTYYLNEAGHFRALFLYSSSLCTAGKLDFEVKDKDSYTLHAVTSGNYIKPEGMVNLLYAILLGVMALTGLAGAWHYFRKKVLPPPPPPSVDVADFNGVEGPFEIPYLSKDQHIRKLLDLSKVSYSLHRRMAAETPYLDISKTIRSSLFQYGMVTPAYSLRQKPREYLFLIDETMANSQQVQLFRYLVKTFLAENVLIDLYFFYNKPDRFYKDSSRVPVNFQKLRDSHFQSGLVIIGNGYNMLHSKHPVIDPALASEFELWDKRVLMTPVPAMDWSSNEKILSALFNLVPADIEGMMNIMKFISDDAAVKTAPGLQEWKTYAARFVDMEDVAALKAYCNDEDLFQWLCAICIHHNLRWEITIEIGRNVLTANHAIHKLNYTSLLKLTRIKWMEEGAFPTPVRLALLKLLTVDNELIARKTMLALLAESDGVINEQSFSYEEKAVQKYTDSFILYANDPVANMAIKVDADKFVSLWNAGKIVDLPLSNYLKKENGNWLTPVRSVTNRQQNVGVDAYIEESIHCVDTAVNKEKKGYRRLAILFTVISAVSVLLLAGIYFFKQKLMELPLSKRIHLITVKDPAAMDMAIDIENNDCFRQFNGGTNSVQANLSVGNVLYKASDSLDQLNSEDTVYHLVFKNVPLKKPVTNTASLMLARNATAGYVRTDIDRHYASYTMNVRGAQCAEDALTIDYHPGSKEDDAAVVKSVQAVYPKAFITLKAVSGAAYSNYIQAGSMIDSAEMFIIAGKLMRAGLVIKQVRKAAGRNSGRFIEINGDPALDRLLPLTIDSLRCLLLHDCMGTTGQLVYIQYNNPNKKDSIELFRRFLASYAYAVPGIEKKDYGDVSMIKYFNPEMKDKAVQLAATATRYFNRAFIAKQDKSKNGRTAGLNHLEVWINMADNKEQPSKYEQEYGYNDTANTKSTSLQLTEDDYAAAAKLLNCDVAAIKAFVEVESSGNGFLSDGTVKVLFEGHIFYKYTKGAYAKSHPTICYPTRTTAFYAKGGSADIRGAGEWKRLQEAMQLDFTAALMSASYGRFQLMGYNFDVCGFILLADFFEAMKKSEGDQLIALCNFLKGNKLDGELRNHQWKNVAVRYNGPGQERSQYAARLEAAYLKYK